MFGVPEQSLDGWRRAVDTAIALAPEHVSAYALTVERGTAFGAAARAGRLVRPDDDVVAQMFEHAGAAFAAAGLPRYEVSSYARPGSAGAPQPPVLVAGAVSGRGRVGVVAAAAGRGTAWRFANPRATDVYLRGKPRTNARHVERRTAADLENEAVWLGLALSPASTAPGIAPVMGSIP